MNNFFLFSLVCCIGCWLSWMTWRFFRSVRLEKLAHDMEFEFQKSGDPSCIRQQFELAGFSLCDPEFGQWRVTNTIYGQVGTFNLVAFDHQYFTTFLRYGESGSTHRVENWSSPVTTFCLWSDEWNLPFFELKPKDAVDERKTWVRSAEMTVTHVKSQPVFFQTYQLQGQFPNLVRELFDKDLFMLIEDLIRSDGAANFIITGNRQHVLIRRIPTSISFLSNRVPSRHYREFIQRLTILAEALPQTNKVNKESIDDLNAADEDVSTETARSLPNSSDHKLKTWITVGALAVSALIYSGWDLVLAEKTTKWPASTGKITDSQLDSESNTDENGHTTTYYSPRISYTYSVDGDEYSSTRVAWNPLKTASSSDANALIEKFGEGKTIDVFYSPNDHATSVLIRGISRNDTKFVTVSLGIVIIGSMIIFFFIGQWRNHAYGIGYHLGQTRRYVLCILLVSGIFTIVQFWPQSIDEPVQAESQVGEAVYSDEEKRDAMRVYEQKIEIKRAEEERALNIKLTEERDLSGTAWEYENGVLKTAIYFHDDGTGVIRRTSPKGIQHLGAGSILNDLYDANGVIEVTFSFDSDSKELRVKLEDETTVKASMRFGTELSSMHFYDISATKGLATVFRLLIKSFVEFERVLSEAN